jgi:hypothetical protein
MLPKNALKRHMMKHEAQDFADSVAAAGGGEGEGALLDVKEEAEDTKPLPEQEEEEELADLHFVQVNFLVFFSEIKGAGTG